MKDKISVLFVIDKLNHGGAQDFLLNFLKHSKSDKFKYHVCSIHKSGQVLKGFYDLNIPIFSLDFFRGNPLSILKTIYLIKKHKIDIVHTFLFASNTYGRIAAILAGTPRIITHEVANDSEWKRSIHIFLDKFLSKFTNYIIANADAVKDYYVNQVNIPASKIIKINTSVNSKPYEQHYDISSEKEKLGLDPKQPVVGFIGRLREQKRPEDFIKIADKLAKLFPKLQFVMVGDGELMPALDKLVGKLNLEKNIFFLGYRDDLPRIISVFDVFVHTSAWEGLPLVIMEAMLSKKPVVATRVDGNAEIVVDGSTGILTDVGEINKMVQAVTEILQNPDMGKKFGENGYKRMKNEFGLEEITEKIEGIYQEILAE